MEMPNKDIDAFERVVLAGLKLMFNEKTFAIFERGLSNEKVPLPQRLATEAAGLMKMLVDRTGGKMPVQIIAPAGAMLLMEMGKFATEAGIAKPTSDDIRQGTVMLVKILASMYAKPQGGQGAAPPPPPAPAPAAPPGLIGV